MIQKLDRSQMKMVGFEKYSVESNRWEVFLSRKAKLVGRGKICLFYLVISENWFNDIKRGLYFASGNPDKPGNCLDACVREKEHV